MNKLSLLILIFLIINNCSIKKRPDFWGKENSNIKEVENIKKILTKQVREEQEFNSTLKISISGEQFTENFINNQNDIGEFSYEGILEEVGKYNFSKFNDFEYIDVQPVFYNQNLIFFDDKGAIIIYDQNQKIIWKKNFYNKTQKKLKPRLNFANKKIY